MSHEELYENGMELFAEDQLELAIEELKQAVEANPEFGDALHALTMCYYHHGDLDQALEDGTRFRDQESSNPLAYTSLAMIYHAKGMVPEAEDMGAKARTAEQSDGAEH